MQGRRLIKLTTAGIAVLAATALLSGLWSGLLLTNLRTTPAMPWSVAVMAVVLWAAWTYAGGRGPPPGTAAFRRDHLRARRIDAESFLLAVLAGGLGLVALTGVWVVAFQTGLMQGNSLPDFSTYPPLTVVLVITMAAVVGAVVEEAGFRGYFQTLLERAYSAPTAILVTALLLAPGHAATQGFAGPTFVFYLLVDAMLGTTAYLLSDAWFWIHAAQALVFAALSVVVFLRLAARRPHVAQRNL